MVSDIVLLEDLPESIRDSISAYTACVAGAVRKEKYLGEIRAAGFQDVEILEEKTFPVELALGDPQVKAVVETLGSVEKAKRLAAAVASIKVYAKKPSRKRDDIQISPAGKEDKEGIQALLAENGLPGEDISSHLGNFIVAKEGRDIVGCIGMEIYGKIGFLRSLAVRNSHRHQGYAEALYRDCERRAAALGIEDLYLLTVTAESFFARRGWMRIKREEAPEAISQTAEFKGLCPESALCMRKQVAFSIIPAKCC